MKSIEGELYQTYLEACLRRGFLSNNVEDASVMDALELSLQPIAEQLAMMLSYCEQAKPIRIFRESMTMSITDSFNTFRSPFLLSDRNLATHYTHVEMQNTF